MEYIDPEPLLGGKIGLDAHTCIAEFDAIQIRTPDVNPETTDITEIFQNYNNQIAKDAPAEIADTKDTSPVITLKEQGSIEAAWTDEEQVDKYDVYMLDENGNITEGGGKQIKYDYENRPIKITTPTSITEFVYDYTGQRTKKTVTQYEKSIPYTIYVGNIYEIYGSVATKYIYANVNRAASKDSDGKVLYYHNDHLGGSNIITDADGKVVQYLEYLPYGEINRNIQFSDTDTPYKFTGKELDSETGLYYYGARYYSPVLARFISPDSIVQAPYDPQTLNRYAYCRNNPVKYIDPSGHYTFDIAFEYSQYNPEISYFDKGMLFGAGGVAIGMFASPLLPTYLKTTLAIGGSAYLGWTTGEVLTGEKTRITETGLSVEKMSSSEREFKAGLSLVGWGAMWSAYANEISSKASISKRWGPHREAGPLGEEVAKNFRGASYTELTTKEPVTLYRMFGGEAGVKGPWWTKTAPSGPLQTQLDSAILPEWGNTFGSVGSIRVPTGTTIYEGFAAPQYNNILSLIGGGNQVYIPHVDPSWIINP